MTSTKRTLSLAGIGLAAVATMGTFLALSTGVTHVAPGESIQAALNAAQCGAVIELDAGAIYPGNLTLPNKQCDTYITIQSSRAAELPEGQRVTPAQASLFARIQSTVNAEPVIKTTAGAHHYKFIGIQFETASEGVFVYDLIRFGEGRETQTTRESVPHHLVIDRSYVAGRPNQQTQRGVSLNCADCGVTNSYIDNIRGKGMDTQAVCGWNGSLRVYVLNSALIATGENVMFGGADPANGNDPNAILAPENVEIRRNWIYKPMEWKGQGYTIKNDVELKNCKGCTIDANVIENNWANEGQAGVPIVFTVRNQEGSAPYSIIANVVFTSNIVLNAPGGVNFLGTDNEKPSQRAQAALVANNVFDKITGPWITINGYPDASVVNNTVLMTCSEGCNTTTLYGEPSERFALRDNVIDEKSYGLFGDGGTQGQVALDKYAPNASVTGNVVAHPYAPWPTGNQSVPALMISSDYRTPYTGKGADIDALNAAQSGTVVSQPPPSPSASASASPTATLTPSATPDVQVISDANVREEPTINSTPEKFIALAGLQGVKGACRQDTASVNTYCAITFTDGRSGYIGAQFLRALSGPSPSPTASPSPSSKPTVPPLSPSPTATATPTPRPSPSPITFCPSGTRPKNGCVCRNGFLGSSGKCR